MPEQPSSGISRDFPPRVPPVTESHPAIELARQRFMEYRDIFAASAKECTEEERKKYIRGSYIVRRENPSSVMHSIQTRSPLIITPIDAPTKTRYSNCAVWNGTLPGFDNAINEGQTDVDGVVTTIGFHESPGMDLKALPEAQIEIGGLKRENVRSFSGELPFEELCFIHIRVPIEAVPEELMTGEEKDVLDEAVAARNQGRPQARYFVRWYVLPRKQAREMH